MSEPTPAQIHATVLEDGQGSRATPFTLVWYTSWLVMGVVQIAGGLIAEWSPSMSRALLPDWVALLIGIVVTIGAALMLWGARHVQTITTSWAVERLGAFITAGGWASYAIAGMWASFATPAAWLFGVASTAALLARAQTLTTREAVTRHIVGAA